MSQTGLAVSRRNNLHRMLMQAPKQRRNMKGSRSFSVRGAAAFRGWRLQSE